MINKSYTYILFYTIFICLISIQAQALYCPGVYEYNHSEQTFTVLSCTAVTGGVQVKKTAGASLLNFSSAIPSGEVYRTGPNQGEYYSWQETIEASCVNSTTLKQLKHVIEDQCWCDDQSCI